jgi:hypothetical protein
MPRRVIAIVALPRVAPILDAYPDLHFSLSNLRVPEGTRARVMALVRRSSRPPRMLDAFDRAPLR